MRTKVFKTSSAGLNPQFSPEWPNYLGKSAYIIWIHINLGDPWWPNARQKSGTNTSRLPRFGLGFIDWLNFPVMWWLTKVPRQFLTVGVKMKIGGRTHVDVNICLALHTGHMKRKICPILIVSTFVSTFFCKIFVGIFGQFCVSSECPTAYRKNSFA